MQTQFGFTLPRGYIDAQGSIHRNGVMRLATAFDEISPLSDVRVRGNEAYLALLLLSQVIVVLGELSVVTPRMLENFFAVDIIYLQEFYSRINGLHEAEYLQVFCPNCGHGFNIER